MIFENDLTTLNLQLFSDSHTMSGSILMGESHAKKGKVDSRMNMGSGILEDKNGHRDFDFDVGSQKSTLKYGKSGFAYSITKKHQVLSYTHLIMFYTIRSSSITRETQGRAKDNSDSVQFQMLSSMSAQERNKAGASSSFRKGAGIGSSSSHYEKSLNATPRDDQKKKLESASLDLSDSSSKKYW